MESIPGGAIPLFVGGLVGAVIWQLARKARTFFASGELQDKVARKLDHAKTEKVEKDRRS